MRFGYGRVSTRDQHTEAQHDALLAAGVDPKNIYVEKAPTRLALRPKLEELRKVLRDGDTIVVTKVDRLARSPAGPHHDRRRTAQAGHHA